MNFKFLHKNFYFFVVFWAIFMFFVDPAWAVTVDRTLKFGDRNLEVKDLQTILNSNSKTQVASTGEGSKGKETDYFGEKTRSAVIKFQKLNKIKVERGRVGPQTMIFLNKNLFNNPSNETVDGPEHDFSCLDFPTSNNCGSNNPWSVGKPSGATNSVTQVTGAPFIDSITPNSGGNNASIVIKGRNFLSTNTISTSYADIDNVFSSDGKTINLTISLPVDQIFRDDSTGQVSIPNGFSWPIQIYVSNKNGLSNNATYNLTF